MPFYDLRCTNCGTIQEIQCASSELAATRIGIICDTCGNQGAETVIGTPAMLFKGEGTAQQKQIKSRFAKRNARLDALPEDQRRRMAKFMQQHDVLKTPPGVMRNPKQDKKEE